MAGASMSPGTLGELDAAPGWSPAPPPAEEVELADLAGFSGRCLLAAVPMTILAVRSAGFHFEEIQLDPVAATRRFIGFVATLLAVFGTSAAAGGILQLSLYRVRLLRELSLDRSDLKREQRLHEGPGNRQG